MSSLPRYQDLRDRTDIAHRVTDESSLSQFTKDGFMATHSDFQQGALEPGDLREWHDELYGEDGDSALNMEIERHVDYWADEGEGSRFISTSSCLDWAVKEVHKRISWNRKGVKMWIIKMPQSSTNARKQQYGRARPIVPRPGQPGMIGYHAIDHLKSWRPSNFAKASSQIVWFGNIPAASVLHETTWSATLPSWYLAPITGEDRGMWIDYVVWGIEDSIWNLFGNLNKSKTRSKTAATIVLVVKVDSSPASPTVSACSSEKSFGSNNSFHWTRSNESPGSPVGSGPDLLDVDSLTAALSRL